MAPSLNVIALISGGKDSLFSILHCQANGHRVIALANLHPGPLANGDEQDTNSYMYQTVGHSVIPLYEHALGLPLYRREITGTAVNSSRDYSAPVPSLLLQQQKQEQDETEDLVPLLTRVMEAHPDANAVSTGAILSTYQRTRVESVALRLGLTPLSYLWQYPLLPPYTQSSLLHDMRAVGQEAIIIKTASGGLDESFLGLDVASPATMARLAQAMGRFGDAGDGAILGEGGEFETLALNGPRPLWKKKIRIHNGPSAVLEGGQTVLKVQASSLEDHHQPGEEDEGPAAGLLRIPDLFDYEFAKVLETTQSGNQPRADVADNDSLAQSTTTTTTTTKQPLSHTSIADHLPTNTCSETSTVFTYSNLTSSSSSSSSSVLSPSRQLAHIFLRLNHVLQQRHIPKASISHCTLVLRTMTDFTILNPLYAQYFSAVNPPARVTIAAGPTMPTSTDVMLSVVVDKTGLGAASSRQGLHVQGRSYWAPANIGPYSQAISVRLPPPPPAAETMSNTDTTNNNNSYSENTSNNETLPPTTTTPEIVYIAGQIPLVPSSMQPHTSQGFPAQTALSLQHLWRISRAKRVAWWTAAVAFLPAACVADPSGHVRMAQDMWRDIHLASPSPSGDEEDEEEDEEQDIDPWDKLNTQHSASRFEDKTVRLRIPDYTCVRNDSNNDNNEDKTKKSRNIPIPPCFVAQISSLPLAVDIEWSATGLASTQRPSSIHFSRSQHGSGSSGSSTQTAVQDTRTKFVTLEVLSEDDVQSLARLSSEWTTGTLYVSHDFGYSTQLNSVLVGGGRGVQWIPCQRVWGEGGKEVGAVFVGRIDG
jgi:diphthine-ammonia ligase